MSVIVGSGACAALQPCSVSRDIVGLFSLHLPAHITAGSKARCREVNGSLSSDCSDLLLVQA